MVSRTKTRMKRSGGEAALSEQTLLRETVSEKGKETLLKKLLGMKFRL